MDKLLKIAIAELGQKEVQGSGNNPAIVNYAREAGFDWIQQQAGNKDRFYQNSLFPEMQGGLTFEN